jgi:hypothetical protein
MKRPFNTETDALANQARMNRRRGTGPTSQVAYPCPDCMEDGPVTWHLRTERPIEGKILKLRGPKRRRPSARPWEDEDLEGKWAA